MSIFFFHAFFTQITYLWVLKKETAYSPYASAPGPTPACLSLASFIPFNLLASVSSRNNRGLGKTRPKYPVKSWYGEKTRADQQKQLL